MNKKDKRYFIDIMYRYAILLVLAFFGLKIFYFLFEPLTIYPTYFLFKLFYNPILVQGSILNFPSNLISLKIIGACVAGSAYYLLAILNFSTPGIKISKRLKLLVIAFFSFLVLNVLRIFLIGVFFLERFPWAKFAHEFFWYFGSIAIVILIWFIEVKKAKIKKIPFYSDLIFVKNKIKKI
jgi:exosortase/archaeosortase family protein